MPDPRDYKLDISGLSPAEHGGTDSNGREFIGVMFNCCNLYARIYKNRHKTAYTGKCPRCRKSVSVAIGPGGTRSRFFQAG